VDLCNLWMELWYNLKPSEASHNDDFYNPLPITVGLFTSLPTHTRSESKTATVAETDVRG